MAVCIKKILILGDGNFSFSHSLIQQLETLRNRNPDVHPNVVSTSFDSHTNLIRKYPEAEHKLRDLQNKDRISWISIFHNIDATRIRDSFNKQHHDCGAFDDVVFNFPHLGFENVRVHNCLLAHIMESSKSVLKCNGTITIALAESQGVTWNIEEVGRRLGLICIRQVPIVAADWPGYELKRHHTARSFQSRVQKCNHYVFRRLEDTYADGCFSMVEILKKFRLESKVNELDNCSGNLDQPNGGIEKEKKSKKKRKVHMLVEGMYSLESEAHISGSGVSNSTGNQYKCHVCERRFPTEQGVRTHVYNVHILSNSLQSHCAVDSAGWESLPTASSTLCEECNRRFSNSDALHQHKIAKHVGIHLNLSAEREKNKEQDEPNSETELICQICLWKFPDLSSFLHHQQDDFIPVDASFEFSCNVCFKIFNEERAWKQHRNFCIQRCSTPDRE